MQMNNKEIKHAKYTPSTWKSIPFNGVKSYGGTKDETYAPKKILIRQE